MYPVLLEFGFITIFSLWLFVAIGFVAGSWVFVNLAKRTRMILTELANHSLTIFAISLISARIFFVIFNPDLYFFNFSWTSIFNLFALWDKGLSFWGAVVGFSAALFWTFRYERESLTKLWDILIPSLLFGMVFGHIGAFLDGINYGTPTNVFWGVTFRSANVKYISAVHPTQLYAIFYTILILFLLFIANRNVRQRPTGFISHLGIVLYSFFKFFEEFVRGDEAAEIAGLRLPQVIAAIVLILGAYTFYRRYLAATARLRIPGGVRQIFRLRANSAE